jgi:hypothetical protein
MTQIMEALLVQVTLLMLHRTKSQIDEIPCSKMNNLNSTGRNVSLLWRLSSVVAVHYRGDAG